jgi:hypothetical protein
MLLQQQLRDPRSTRRRPVRVVVVLAHSWFLVLGFWFLVSGFLGLRLCYPCDVSGADWRFQLLGQNFFWFSVFLSVFVFLGFVFVGGLVRLTLSFL